MPRIREQVEIDAPVQRVWAAVHQDIAAVSGWAKSLNHTEVVGGGVMGAGSELLYTARLPGGLSQDLHLVVTQYERNRRCAGTVEGSALRGRWSWTYRERGGVTAVVYQASVALKGVLRFAGAAIADRMLSDVRDDLQALKAHVERRDSP